jgi:hypothetical protein
MAVMEQQQRELKPTPEAEALYRRWVSHLNDEFTRHQSMDRRAEIVRDELHQIYLGRPHGGRMNATLSSEWATNVLTETFDPRNATLRSEYYDDIDAAKFALRKPLIWFWLMFDRSPLGLNLWLGLKFRCMLGHHIFARLGKGVKIYRNVDFTYGYNLTIEDDCVIHRGAYLDDRQEIFLTAGSHVREGERVEPLPPM